MVSLNMDLRRDPHNAGSQPATLSNSSPPQPPVMHHKARRRLLSKLSLAKILGLKEQKSGGTGPS